MACKLIRFTIPGPPMGKPRMTRSDKWRKRDCVLRYRAWADLARMCARAAGCPTDSKKVIRFTVAAYFKPPEKSLDRLGKPHQQTPDADNILKAAADAIFERDEGLAQVAASKTWARVSRLEVLVEVNEED